MRGGPGSAPVWNSRQIVQREVTQVHARIAVTKLYSDPCFQRTPVGSFTQPVPDGSALVGTADELSAPFGGIGVADGL
jgi:hypothetical protein